MTADIVKRRFSVTLTGPYIEKLDILVERGFHMDHQDAMRHALRRLFQHHGMEPLYSEQVEEDEKVQEKKPP